MTTKEEQLAITKYDLLFESRLSKVEATMDNVVQTLNRLESKVDKHFMWIVGIIVVFFGGSLATGILRAMHILT